jgi:hypothetical protein
MPLKISGGKSMAASPKLTHRSKKMYSLIESYLSHKGKITQKAFSQQKGIPLSTFQWWLKHYRESSATLPPASSLTAGPEQGNLSPQPFIPFPCPTEGRWGFGSEEKRADSPSHYVIEYPNGVIIRISGSVEVEVLRQLILSSEG